MTRYTPSAVGKSRLAPDREGVALHCGIPGPEAQHGPAARRARPGGHWREALARLCAQVSPDPRCEHPYHWFVRRTANPARRPLCLPWGLAHGSVGPAPLTDALQRTLPGGLHAGIGLASLAGTAAGHIPVSGLERFVVAHDLHRRRHLAQGPSAHHGHWRPIHGAPRADDARAARRRVADYPLRLDARSGVCPAALPRAELADHAVPMVHAGAGPGGAAPGR